MLFLNFFVCAYVIYKNKPTDEQLLIESVLLRQESDRVNVQEMGNKKIVKIELQETIDRIPVSNKEETVRLKPSEELLNLTTDFDPNIVSIWSNLINRIRDE